MPKHKNANGRRRRRRIAIFPSFVNATVVSVVEVAHHYPSTGVETSTNRVRAVRHPPQLTAAAVDHPRFQLAVGPRGEKHHCPEEEEDGGIGSESAERQTRTFRHAEDMNNVILTTVKAGAPDLDVPGQGRARRRVGEMSIAGAPGVHRNIPDLQNRRVAAAETARGRGLQTMDGNGEDTRQTGRAVIGTDRPHIRLHRRLLILTQRDHRMNHLQGHQPGLRPGRGDPIGENVLYLPSVEWIGGGDHLLSRSRMLMKRKEDVMNEAGAVITIAIAGIHPTKGSNAND